MKKQVHKSGFTLIELMVGVFVLSIASLAIIGAFISQATLNEHAYNLTRSAHDANRVLEQIRRQNSSGCAAPTAGVAGGWDAWLAGQNPGKSILTGNVAAEQLILVTCEDEDGGALAADACGTNQVDAAEWRSQAANTAFDPIRVTVAVCWRHRGRVMGECTWNGAALSANDADADGVITSPSTLTTLITCRG